MLSPLSDLESSNRAFRPDLAFNRPFETTIEKKFSNILTGARATLFRCDQTKEYVLAFKGTSSILDVVTDFRKALVDCTPAVGTECKNCYVGPLAVYYPTHH